jgi:hypothetical protein
MDSSRILVALQEQDKWRDRRARLGARLQSLHSQRRFLQRELDAVRRKVGRLEEIVANVPGGQPLRGFPAGALEQIR